MATIMTGTESQARWPLACVLLSLLASGAVDTTGGTQDRMLPIAVRDTGANTEFTGAPVDVLLRLDLSGLDRLEIVRLVRRFPDKAWQLAEITRAPADRLLLRGQPDFDTLLVLRTASHPGYLLDGPFRWPSEPSTYVISPRWRRTIRGTGHRSDAVSLTWLPAQEDDGPPDGWPNCAWVNDEAWECVGVPLAMPGIVFGRPGGRVRHSVAPGVLTRQGIEDVSAADGAWGRLLAVRGTQPGLAAHLASVRVLPMRFVSSAASSDGTTLEAGADGSVQVTPVGRGAFWLSGAARVRDGWVEVGGPGLAPARLRTSDIASATPDVPLRVALEPPVEIFGRVMAGPELPAAGALVRLFRLARDPASPDAEPRPVLVAEQHANSDGEFRFGDLSMERYEIAAAHPQLGRGERRIDPDGQPIEIDLRQDRLPRPFESPLRTTAPRATRGPNRIR